MRPDAHRKLLACRNGDGVSRVVSFVISARMLNLHTREAPIVHRLTLAENPLIEIFMSHLSHHPFNLHSAAVKSVNRRTLLSLIAKYRLCGTALMVCRFALIGVAFADVVAAVLPYSP